MLTSDAKFEWAVNVIGGFYPCGLSNDYLTHDVHLFVNQVAFMAPVIRPQVVLDSLHTHLRGIALEWYNLRVVQSEKTFGHGIEPWVSMLLQSFDTGNTTNRT